MNRRTFLTTSSATSLSLLVQHALAVEEKKPAAARSSKVIRSDPRRSGRDNLKVIGKLPKELNGLFVRNGPNPQFEPNPPYPLVRR